MILLTRAVELAQGGRVTWTRSEYAPPLKGGAAYDGRVVVDGATWRFLVLSFGIEEQGFPAGSLGYDGTVVVGSTIVRMTRDVAATMHAAASTAVADG